MDDSEYDGTSGSEEEPEGLFLDFEVAEARAIHQSRLGSLSKQQI